MSIKTYDKGEIVFKQGDFAEEMYDIISGSVGIYYGYGTENQIQLAVLRSNDFLGEMAMIETYPRSATAVAEADNTDLYLITEEEFSDYFKNQTDRLLLIMRQISQRLRYRTEECEKALDTLNEMTDTKGTPDKRSKSLLDRIDEYFRYYSDLMTFDTFTD